MQINEEKYGYIRDGIPVKVKKPNGQTEEKRAIIIDFQNPNDMKKNHFLAVKEMKIHGDLYRRRTDIVGFVNGIPLLFIELKRTRWMLRMHTLTIIQIILIQYRIYFITMRSLCFLTELSQK